MDHSDKEIAKIIACVVGIALFWIIGFLAVYYGIEAADKEKTNPPSAWNGK